MPHGSKVAIANQDPKAQNISLIFDVQALFCCDILNKTTLKFW